MRRQLEAQLNALDSIQKMIKSNSQPFNRKIGEFAETFNFFLINQTSLISQTKHSRFCRNCPPQ
jgi:hypothetical protein